MRTFSSHCCGDVTRLTPRLGCVSVNDTEGLGPLQTVNISDPAATKLTLKDLEALSRYRFYLRSCTTVGCGHTVTEDSTTTAKEREYFFIIYRPLSTG